MADIQTHFLDVLNDLYGKPAYPKGFASMLQGYADLPEEALRAAAEKVVASHNRPPNLKTLQKVLASAETVASVPMDTSVRLWDTKTRDRLEWEAERDAIRLIREQAYSLAMAADRGGYLKRLVEFVTDHGRLPLSAEIDAFKRKSADVLREIESERNGDLGPHLQRWHSNMLDSIGAKVLGDDAVVRAADIKVLKGRQKGAGSDYQERRKAEAHLKELAADVPPLTLSPEAMKIFDKRG